MARNDSGEFSDRGLWFSAVANRKLVGPPTEMSTEDCRFGSSGVKTPEERGGFCRAYPSFVRMKRHDPQILKPFLGGLPSSSP